MTSAVVYFDGGSSTPPGKKKKNELKVSWGVVSCMEDEQIEVNGMVVKKRGQVTSGCHEWVALIEATLLMHNRGYKPHECSFYTDDQFIAFAHTYVQDENYLISSRDKVIAMIDYIVHWFYPNAEGLRELVFDYIKHSHMNWVKGHGLSVYNCRADYLVRQARSQAPLLSYDRWLADFCVLGGERARAIGASFLNADRCHFRNML